MTTKGSQNDEYTARKSDKTTRCGDATDEAR